MWNWLQHYGAALGRMRKEVERRKRDLEELRVEYERAPDENLLKEIQRREDEVRALEMRISAR